MIATLFDHFPPRIARTHELTGPSAMGYVFSLARLLNGPVLWVREVWRSEQINPAGFSLYIDPHMLLMAKGKDQIEVLATAEEALRSGAVTLVVMELNKPISLTAGRRLQLAAKAGKTTGLCILPDGMGSNAAETRWQCEPVFDAIDSTLQHWKLIKNKSGTLGEWEVKWDVEAGRVIVVSQIGQRPVS